MFWVNKENFLSFSYPQMGELMVPHKIVVRTKKKKKVHKTARSPAQDNDGVRSYSHSSCWSFHPGAHSFEPWIPPGRSCPIPSNWGDKGLLTMCHHPLRICLPSDFPKTLHKSVPGNCPPGPGSLPTHDWVGNPEALQARPSPTPNWVALNKCQSLNSFTKQVEQRGNTLISHLPSSENSS